MRHCPKCEQTRPINDFFDPKLASRYGTHCMPCKGHVILEANKIDHIVKSQLTNTRSLPPSRSSSNRACRVCAIPLVIGDNWSESRKNKYDYICSLCHSKGRKSPRTISSNLTDPHCRKCEKRLTEGENWTVSRRKKYDYICKECSSPKPIITPNEVVDCPKCDTQMVLRKNRSNGNYFWGCSSFPYCRGTRPYR